MALSLHFTLGSAFSTEKKTHLTGRSTLTSMTVWPSSVSGRLRSLTTKPGSGGWRYLYGSGQSLKRAITAPDFGSNSRALTTTVEEVTNEGSPGWESIGGGLALQIKLENISVVWFASSKTLWVSLCDQDASKRSKKASSRSTVCRSSVPFVAHMSSVALVT